MMTKYYYLRDEKNAPLVTVCLVKDNDKIARGISICSGSENPRRKKGRDKALGRALKALTSELDGDPITRIEALRILNKIDINFSPYTDLQRPVCKSIFLDSNEVTDHEKRILKC